MLAQNLMTATDLKIPEDVHGALIKVLGMLERGELKHLPATPEWPRIFPKQESGQFFNMATVEQHPGCGTVACIGGWVYLIQKKRTPGAIGLETDAATQELKELYFPPFNRDNYNAFTAEQAASALRNYLTTGKSDWEGVVGAA